MNLNFEIQSKRFTGQALNQTFESPQTLEA